MSYSKTNWQNLPSTSTPILAEYLNNIENGIADVDGAIGVDAYDSTSTYAVGDYCIYNNTLYKCITAIATAENFDSTKWAQISIIEEINIKENINNKATSISSQSTNTQYASAKAVYDYIENLNIYSTTEQKIGTWINRKTII